MATQPELDVLMSRFNETENALIARLHTLKAKPDVTIALTDINDPLADLGVTKDDISAVLQALEQDRVIAFAPGNRILMLKSLP